jgi:hypothetical protein
MSCAYGIPPDFLQFRSSGQWIKIPFDLNGYRTISIETRDPYTLMPKIQTYTAEVANQVRRALEDSESGDNPISLYYPSAKLNWDEG